MTARKTRPTSVSEYIAAAPSAARKKLRGMRECIRKAAPDAVKAFAKELAKFNTARGSIQFPLEKPLPLPLIRSITTFRVRESLERDRKWRTLGSESQNG